MGNHRGVALRPGSLLGCLALLGGMVLAAPRAHAALGSDYASIAADAAQLRAAIKITPHTGYEVHEITLPSGTAVREYVSGGGIVFAVAWNGPAMPDLRQTLGNYFGAYVAAAQANRSGHHHLAATHGDLVIQSHGRMRAFIGRAYLASAVPAATPIDELR
jgi:hypothetical protein